MKKVSFMIIICFIIISCKQTIDKKTSQEIYEPIIVFQKAYEPSEIRKNEKPYPTYFDKANNKYENIAGEYDDEDFIIILKKWNAADNKYEYWPIWTTEKIFEQIEIGQFFEVNKDSYWLQDKNKMLFERKD